MDENLEDEQLEDEDLEETAADPALEADPDLGPSREPHIVRRGVERPKTDGAPMLEEPGTVPEDPDHPEAFGRWLRSQRELRGIRLGSIADSSKISLGHLKALESGRFDLLPAEVFTKGFLRQYAGFVGLDPEETINFYLAARDHAEEEDDPLQPAPPPKEASGARWVLVALLMAAVLVGVIWGLQRLTETPQGTSRGTPEDSSSASSTSPRSTTSPTTPRADIPGAEEDGAEDGSVPDPAPQTASGDPAGATGQDENTAGQPRAGGADAGAVAELGGASARPADVPLRVVLDFSDTCWVSALIDGGETREKVHAQGESLTLDAQNSVELKVGNYRAVEVEANGIPYDLGSRGRAGSVVRTVRIDLESVRAAPAAD